MERGKIVLGITQQPAELAHTVKIIGAGVVRYLTRTAVVDVGEYFSKYLLVRCLHGVAGGTPHREKGNQAILAQRLLIVQDNYNVRASFRDVIGGRALAGYAPNAVNYKHELAQFRTVLESRRDTADHRIWKKPGFEDNVGICYGVNLVIPP